jgi:FkbM family methyltransferase
MSEFGLVIIGAHIGVHINKDLEEYKNQKVILIEPVPHNLKSLKTNTIKYKNIFIEPVTIGNKNENRMFYYIKEQSIAKLGKHWASGIGSFDKQHILNHKTKRFKVRDDDIDTIKIESLTFKALCEKYQISKIDKLQIDVEGAEYEILNSINYKKISINKILFEFKHFDGTFKEGEKLDLIKKKLIFNNYDLTQVDQENILAKKNNIIYN